MLEVFGDPVPTVQWFKGFKDLKDEGQRFKIWTDGATNQAVLGIEGLKQEDEGAYRCVLDNGNGEVEHEFSVYVTGMHGVGKSQQKVSFSILETNGKIGQFGGGQTVLPDSLV